MVSILHKRMNRRVRNHKRERANTRIAVQQLRGNAQTAALDAPEIQDRIMSKGQDRV